MYKNACQTHNTHFSLNKPFWCRPFAKPLYCTHRKDTAITTALGISSENNEHECRNIIFLQNLVLVMVNVMKDISSTVEKPDKERQEDALESSGVCEHFVAAACLNESMPFDVQTSEFGEYHFFLNGVNGQRLQYVFCCRSEHYSSYYSLACFSTAIVEGYVKSASKPRGHEMTVAGKYKKEWVQRVWRTEESIKRGNG